MISTGADPIVAVAIAKASAKGDALAAPFHGGAMLQNVAEVSIWLSENNMADARQPHNYQAMRSMVNAKNKEGQ